MPIDADRVRELAARREGTHLDYKVQGYDFTNRAGNLEMTKDLMAMVNSLRLGSEPAYILVGVADDGQIAGVDPASHLDDASMHQKVSGHLNRMPVFSYSPVNVDGLSVGVFEIQAGGRPLFPLRDAPPLRRHVALFRDGSSTDVASPSQIIEWYEQDTPRRLELLDAELKRHKAEAAVRGRMTCVSVSTGPDGVKFSIHITNLGRAGFRIESLLWRVEWRALPATTQLPPDYEPPIGSIDIGPRDFVPPGNYTYVDFQWGRGPALTHFQTSGAQVDGFNGGWAAYHIEAHCVTDLGGRDVLRAVGAQRA